MPEPTAYSVEARMTAHEALCAERWGQIRQSLSSLWWIIVSAAGALIVGMGGLIITLAMHGK